MCRKCLILAAGQGTRIRDQGTLKPLVPVLGVPLIERVVVNVARTGIRDIYVVTGYNAPRLENFLKELAKKRRLNLRVLVNHEWWKENGVSVLRAEKEIHETFLLLMGDHLVDPEILKELVRRGVSPGRVTLAVDHNVQNGFVDVQDATKVYTNNGSVVRIGKDLDHYNGYDTGVFLCSPSIFDAIKESIQKHRDSSLTGAVACLARKGMVDVWDIGKRYWIDVDDARALKKAEKLLIRQVKAKPNDGPVSRFLNRPLSLLLSERLARFPIRPNQITLFSFLMALLGAICIATGSKAGLIMGGVLAQASSVIDGCDGEIARLKYLETEFGAWFDAVLDRYADAFLLGALWYHVYQRAAHELVFGLGLLAVIGSFMVSYTADKYDAMRRVNGGKGIRIGRDIRMFILFIGCLLNQPFWTLLILAVLMNGEALRRIFVMRSALCVS